MAARRRLLPEGILDHVNMRPFIHQRDVHPTVCQQAPWMTGKIFLCRSCDALLLRRADMAGGTGKAAAFLDLDKDNRVAVAQDQIDLPARTPPAPMRQLVAAPFIVAGDR